MKLLKPAKNKLACFENTTLSPNSFLCYNINYGSKNGHNVEFRDFIYNTSFFQNLQTANKLERYINITI